jgi:hypothetical protein
MANRKPFWKHVRNSIFWIAGNSLFGLAPLLFLQLISVLSGENICSKETEQLIQDGVILFVSCAIIGSVVIDFILSEFKIKGWLLFFAIYISPFCILIYIFLNYLLIYVQYSDEHDFGPGSFTTWLTAGFAIIYCIFVKTIYYIKQEEARH